MKPRVLLLVDRRDWAFDHSARQIARHLAARFDLDISYVREKPALEAKRYDLVYVFFWGETYHQRFFPDPERVIKGVSSHRWEDDPRYGPCTPAELVHRHLNDAGTVICTSRRLFEALRDLHPHVFHAPNGFDPRQFHPLRRRQTDFLRIGWAGDATDPVKRFREIVEPACAGHFHLSVAPGRLPHKRMNQFYNAIDALAISSEHEGEPLTLIEAMAAGCFPVALDVGVVPELVRSGENGLVVREPTPAAFREAFRWCEANLARVRRAGEENAAVLLQERSWEVVAPHFESILEGGLARLRRPRFRNDDVSWDTPLDWFKRFCGIFHQHGFSQIHGVTLFGKTMTRFRHGGEPVEYEHTPNIARLPNARIRELSRGFPFEDRDDLIEYLRTSEDEIALHGLYHTDYSAMTPEEQQAEIAVGLAILKRLFPEKRIRYFIPPFNRKNEDTPRICREFSLALVGTTGVHLEEKLAELVVEPETWYRYHHHRFYPGSTFDYYRLSLERLDSALARTRTGRPMDANKRGWRLRLLSLLPGASLKHSYRSLSLEQVQAVVARHGVQDWFVYIFRERSTRWDLWEPLDWIVRRIKRSARILETGCGIGLNLIWLGERGFEHLWGLDNDPRAIAAGHELSTSAGCNIPLVLGDGFAPGDLVPGPFDLVIALNWTQLNQPFVPSDLLRQYHGRLAPGGFMILDVIDRSFDSVPNNQYLTSDWGKPEKERRPSEYKVRFSRAEIQHATQAAGFRIERMIARPQIIPKAVYILRRS